MAKQVRHLRGTTAETALYLGMSGEIVYDEDLRTLRAMDGKKTGGMVLQREPFASVADMLASTEEARGEGSAWRAGQSEYSELPDSVSDPAMTTAGGVKLAAKPVNDGCLTAGQFGARRDGSDDGAAISSLMQYAHTNGYTADLGAGEITIGARATPLLEYDRAADGALNRLKVKGQGPTVTLLKLTGQLDDFLFKITGDTSAYGAPHASWIDFEDFGIEGDGASKQDLFSIVCADRVNFRAVQAYNFAGYGIYAREWWDSLCDVRFVRGGDSASGAEKDVIDLGYYFASDVANSGCNNIMFPETFQCEGYRWRAMRWGNATRRCSFTGKVHENLSTAYTQPAILIDGGTDNRFVPGFSITHSQDDSPRQRDILVTNTGYIPARNYFSGGSMGLGIEFSGDCRQNIVMGNFFDNGTEAAVEIGGGQRNIVRDNMPRGTGPEVAFASIGNLEPVRVQSRVYIGEVPAGGWGAAMLHVSAETEDNVAILQSSDHGAFVQFIDPSAATERRIGVQGGNIRAQEDGVNQASFDT